MFEGKTQIYGSQFQPDKNGEPVPYPIENPEGVNDRRRAVGLNTLEERTAELRNQMARENVPLPPDWEAHQKKYVAWLHSVGWRK